MKGPPSFVNMLEYVNICSEDLYNDFLIFEINLTFWHAQTRPLTGV
jgi:hypothetical protein